MYMNLPYPHWYKEYCLLNLPENEAVWTQKMRDIAAILGAPARVFRGLNILNFLMYGNSIFAREMRRCGPRRCATSPRSWVRPPACFRVLEVLKDIDSVIF